jgi:hypothetical protein
MRVFLHPEIGRLMRAISVSESITSVSQNKTTNGLRLVYVEKLHDAVLDWYDMDEKNPF